MPKHIVKIRDRYFEWSTVVDAPVTYGMTLDELREHVREEYGNSGLEALPRRLERVERKGSSAHRGDLDSLLRVNRAGDRESHATEAEIYRRFHTDPIL